MDLRKALSGYTPHHDYFIGIDSDGCVFDSMEVKQKEFFIPNALKYFNLFPVSSILRKIWEFVNLYSINRGGNRFISLIKVFELLGRDERIKKSGVKLPDMTALKQWTQKESRLGNESLRKYLQSNHDPDLEKILQWSEAVNEDIGRWLRNIPPFPAARQAIETISQKADIVIVSQTPFEAIEREWRENDLDRFIKFIAAQEHGTKTEHLAIAAKGKYDDNRILMIGDAKGDLDAARSNGIMFYPIIPGKENRSWELFLTEAFENFINGKYKGRFENKLINDFLLSLPERQ